MDVPGHTFEVPVLAASEQKFNALAKYQKLQIELPISDKKGAPSITHRLHFHAIGWVYCPTCDLFWPPGPHDCTPRTSRKHGMEVDEEPGSKKPEAGPSYAAAAKMEQLRF